MYDLLFPRQVKSATIKERNSTSSCLDIRPEMNEITPAGGFLNYGEVRNSYI